MRMEHTPGPWHTSFSATANDVVVVDSDGHMVANTDQWPARATVECAANARLIAAAPETSEQRDELLEACEALQRYYGQSGMPHMSGVWAAIAKARGA